MRVAIAVALLLLVTDRALAQMAPANPAGVAMGHLHYRVRDVGANVKFWSALGGTPVRIGSEQAVRLPHVFVFLSAGDYSGLSEGAVVNHVAFRVPSFDALTLPIISSRGSRRASHRRVSARNSRRFDGASRRLTLAR